MSTKIGNLHAAEVLNMHLISSNSATKKIVFFHLWHKPIQKFCSLRFRTARHYNQAWPYYNNFLSALMESLVVLSPDSKLPPNSSNAAFNNFSESLITSIISRVLFRIHNSHLRWRMSIASRANMAIVILSSMVHHLVLSDTITDLAMIP